MSTILKQLEIILSASNIQSEYDAELIIINQDKQCWRFYCAPSLKLQEVKFDDLRRFNCCKLQIPEDVFRSILKNEITAQEALEQKLIVAQGSVGEIIRANIIIDSLREQTFVASLN